MKKPLVISIGLFLFLFGLAFAKTSKSQTGHQLRLPTASSIHAE